MATINLRADLERAMREGPERHIAYLPSTLPSALHPLASSGKELIERARKLSSGLKSSLPSAPMPSESTSSKIADEMFTKKFGELPQQSPLHIADAEFISNGEAYKGKLYVCHDFLCLFSHIEHPRSELEAAIPLRSIASIYPGVYTPQEFPLIRLAVEDSHLCSANAVMLINHDNKVHQFFNFSSDESFERFLEALESAWKTARCCDAQLLPAGNSSLHFSLTSGAFVAERSLLTPAPHVGALSPARAPQILHPYPPSTGVSQPTAHHISSIPTSSVSSNIHPPDDFGAVPPSPKNAMTSSMIPDEEELPLLPRSRPPLAPQH